jgi:hypothetical protein
MNYPWLSILWSDISRAAKEHALDPVLVAAFIAAESAGIANRTRFEPAWNAFNSPATFAQTLQITLNTEKMAQSHSYGLLQVMGATARDLGYAGYLHLLCDRSLGLELGCKFLAKKKNKYPDLKDMISSYNAGTPRKDSSNHYANQQYVDTVLQHYEALKGESHG